jgi:hypothetical protein
MYSVLSTVEIFTELHPESRTAQAAAARRQSRVRAKFIKTKRKIRCKAPIISIGNLRAQETGGERQKLCAARTEGLKRSQTGSPRGKEAFRAEKRQPAARFNPRENPENGSAAAGSFFSLFCFIV